MLVASVVAWRREAHGTAGRPHSGLEAGPGAAQTRPSALRADEIVAATIYSAARASASRRSASGALGSSVTIEPSS
jgi:hypothetical protein